MQKIRKNRLTENNEPTAPHPELGSNRNFEFFWFLFLTLKTEVMTHWVHFSYSSEMTSKQILEYIEILTKVGRYLKNLMFSDYQCLLAYKIPHRKTDPKRNSFFVVKRIQSIPLEWSFHFSKSFLSLKILDRHSYQKMPSGQRFL